MIGPMTFLMASGVALAPRVRAALTPPGSPGRATGEPEMALAYLRLRKSSSRWRREVGAVSRRAGGLPRRALTIFSEPAARLLSPPRSRAASPAEKTFCISFRHALQLAVPFPSYQSQIRNPNAEIWYQDFEFRIWDFQFHGDADVIRRFRHAPDWRDEGGKSPGARRAVSFIFSSTARPRQEEAVAIAANGPGRGRCRAKRLPRFLQDCRSRPLSVTLRSPRSLGPAFLHDRSQDRPAPAQPASHSGGGESCPTTNRPRKKPPPSPRKSNNAWTSWTTTCFARWPNGRWKTLPMRKSPKSSAA